MGAETRWKQVLRGFSVTAERGSEGCCVVSVLELRGCHTWAKSLDVSEVEGEQIVPQEFIGVQRIWV